MLLMLISVALSLRHARHFKRSQKSYSSLDILSALSLGVRFLIFTSVGDTKSMDDMWPSSSYDILEIVATRSQRDMET